MAGVQVPVPPSLHPCPLCPTLTARVLQVALRIRPMSVAELQRGARPIAHRLDEQVVVLRDPTQNPDNVLRASRSREKSYVFDAAFDSTSTQVLQLLLRGNQRRTREPTAANHTSSRSHAVLQVTVRPRGRGLRCGRLQLIDLAGSERAAWTQNRGQRMKEGAHINRSLLALGNCIKALSKPGGSAHVNYRDSKLTRLLKDSLGGNSHTVMIAHISPASTAFEESRSTLTYAQRAKSIRPTVKHKLLSNSPHGSIVANLRGDIQHLKHQLYATPGPGKHCAIRYTQAQVQLREKLLNACHEQAALCQHLVQLEGTALHTRLAAARHLRILTRWKRRAWRRGKEGRREPGGPNESRRNMDMAVPEPPNVITARESFMALVEEQGRLQEQKAELERRFQQSQQHTRRLEEAVQRGSSSVQQQEVLALLCRLHQLQLHNTELRSRSLLQGGPWHFPAAATQPFNQHRAPRAVEVSTAFPRHQGQASGCATLTVPLRCGGDIEQHQKHRGHGCSVSVPCATRPRAEACCQRGQPGGDSHPPGGHPAQPLPRRLTVSVQKAGEGRAVGCQKEREAAAALRGDQPRGRWQQHHTPLRASGDTSLSISPAPGRANTHRSAASWRLAQGPPARTGGTPGAEPSSLLKHSRPSAKQRAEHPSCPPQRPT
eukprot:XP_024997500.1 kinesin-like protein KIF19 isoform X4 [Gallus gallus]